jgi:MFS transporter, putative metabolite:H+ symporter
MQTPKSENAIVFYHVTTFWLGTLLIMLGVIAHIPMFVHSAKFNYQMSGMEMDPLMTAGMYSIIVGIVLSSVALLPPGGVRTLLSNRKHYADNHVQLEVMSNTAMTHMHWKLVLVMLFAIIVDVIKPATLGFVMPGMLSEYNLNKAQVALLPLSGISGTVVGSFLWGFLGDLIGRRPSILLAALFFIGTSVCGVMPSYNWNIIMCFIMGVGAGGMLPITFALLAEIIPAAHRGYLMVLIGGIGSVLGYLSASASATLLEPIFGWRILWLLGLPTGLLLILLNRYIPESPRYLHMYGKYEQARRIMLAFNISRVKNRSQCTKRPMLTTELTTVLTTTPASFRTLFTSPFIGLTWSLGLYAFTWGIVNFGFFLWLPTNLRESGINAHLVNTMITKSAVIAFPVTLLTAFLYYRWSAKGSIIVFGLLMIGALISFLLLGESASLYPWLTSAIIAVLLASSCGVIATLSPYTVEVFPTQIRACASGWTAGMSKFSGVIALSFVSLGFSPNLMLAAFIIVIFAVVSVVTFIKHGVETGN